MVSIRLPPTRAILVKDLECTKGDKVERACVGCPPPSGTWGPTVSLSSDVDLPYDLSSRFDLACAHAGLVL